MTDLNVKIVDLPPMRVASVRAVSTSPEHDAWAKMQAWAEPAGLLSDSEKHPIFGFNNPSPEPGCQSYGYEFWLVVDPGTVASRPVVIADFEGGRYAVTTCKGAASIGAAWQSLVAWAEANHHHIRGTHELEGLHGAPVSEQELVVDLYLPIEQ